MKLSPDIEENEQIIKELKSQIQKEQSEIITLKKENSSLDT